MDGPYTGDDLAGRIDALLPQTQCGQCGQPGCAPFAAAVAAGAASPAACVPGGPALARRLARLLGAPPPPAFEEFLAPLPVPQRARIREADCIGCTKCIAPCPTEAIVGAARQLHGIIEDDCTGCGLCLPPCPVDCIELDSVAPTDWPTAASGPAQALAAGPRLETCTDCGDCGRACPSGLEPLALARNVRQLDIDAAVGIGLERCTACGACDAACPVRIPLVAHFLHGKAVRAALDATAAGAAGALARQAERRRRPPPAALAASPLVSPPPDRDAALAGVAAALARARARRPTAATGRE